MKHATALCAAGLLVAALPALAAAAGGKPNVLVVLADDLGIGDVSAYGAEDVETPHIDGLLARGMRFDNFYANCPVCSPTRAALLSGRYHDLVGVPGVVRTHPEDNWGNLRDGAVLLPALLEEAGYRTAMVGKWHLGLEGPDRPNDRGFGYFKGFLGDMMDDYHDHRRHGVNYMRENTEEIDPEGHATDLFTGWAAEYIGRAGAQDDDAPWFLYLAYNAPHTPVQPPEEWVEMVKGREPGITDRRAKLVALIEHMDDGIGKVLAALKESGGEERTLVIFTSDNGGQVNVGGTNGPWRGGKQDMFEGGLRVAACAAWPGVIGAGSRTGARALTMDLFPTVLEAAGAGVPEGIDGVSLLGVFRDPSAPLPDRDLFWSRREGNQRYMGECVWAMRRGDWKLVKNSPFEPWQLFDLAADPAETSDLAGAEGDTFRELAGAMRRHIQRCGHVPWQ